MLSRVQYQWLTESEISVKVQILGLMLNRHPVFFFIIMKCTINIIKVYTGSASESGDLATMFFLFLA